MHWDAGRIADAAGASLLGDRLQSGPRRTVIDSREVRPGDLFVGLAGEREDGGAYAGVALDAGAWGVLVAPKYAHALPRRAGAAAATLAHPEPLRALQRLAATWRGELGAKVVAITGSTGKTSTKDILAAVLGGRLRTVASPQNLNTEIGLPLAVLAAPRNTEALVLELAMRGPGQIAELAAIAQPDIGVIVNVGPVHLELLGSLEAVAAAKAELIAGLQPGSTIVLPHDEPLLAPHRREDLDSVTFGTGGDVQLLAREHDEVVIAVGGERIVLRPSFTQSHNLRNLLAAVAAARALGVTPEGRLDVAFSALRGERIALRDEIVLINDCYNANPMSMRAALDDLAESAPARRVAVLGDMLELGGEERRFHREIGAFARQRGVDVLVTVGRLAAEIGGSATGIGESATRDAHVESIAGVAPAGGVAGVGGAVGVGGVAGVEGAAGVEVHAVPDARAAAALLPGLLRPRDTVLVKGSRGVGLELIAETLTTGAR